MIAKVLAGIIVVFILVVYFGTESRAATGTVADHRLFQVQRIWEKFDPNRMLFQGGLTDIGYEFFFPGRDVREGMMRWRRMAPFERLAFLEQEGDPLSRGLWASSRNDELTSDFRKKFPEFTEEDIGDVIDNLGIEAVRNCLASKPPMHPDHCILFLARIANPREIAAAQNQVGWYLWLTSNRKKFPSAEMK